MRPLARTALAFLLAAILHGQGMAGYQADCLSGTGDLVISGCTTAIESGEWSDSGLRWAYNSRGGAYYQKGEYERAAADFTEVIKLDPKDVFAHNFRGRSYVELGKYQLAIADFDEAIRLSPKYGNAFYGRGLAYAESGDFDRAIAEFLEARRLDPNDADILYSKGWAHYRKGEYDTAIADLNEAIKMSPDNALNLNLRGASYFHKKKYDLAIADFTEAIRLDPNLSHAHANRGEARIEKGEYALAVIDLDEAIRLDPKSAFAYHTRGRAYKARGRMQLAAADYRKAAELDPTNADYVKDAKEHTTTLAQKDETAPEPEPAPEPVPLITQTEQPETVETPEPDPPAPAPAKSRGAFEVELSDADKPVTLYTKSHALVIGIDEYANGWPRLSNAIRDAHAVAAELERRGFSVEMAINPDSDQLEAAVERFVFEKGSDPEARLFIWFAGHGHTSSNGEGYLVPSGAPGPDAGWRLRRAALSLRSFGRYMREVQSKHVLAVFDSCFAGTIFNTARSRPSAAIDRATTQPVRQFVSSGEAEQTVSDDGTFRRLFIDALNGLEPTADANRDGYVTGSELGLFLSDKITVLTNGRQTPRYGKLSALALDRGDFVFSVARQEKTVNPRAEPRPTPTTQIDNEALFWSSIKDSEDVEDFEDFLRLFPNGMFSGLAKRRLAKLRKSQQ